MSTMLDDWASEECMICGAHRPIAHALVRNGKDWRRAGRVCASHTLKELVLDSEERFLVTVELTDEGVNAIERVMERKLAERKANP